MRHTSSTFGSTGDGGPSRPSDESMGAPSQFKNLAVGHEDSTIAHADWAGCVYRICR
jgi:hypothetical protein